MNYFGNKLSFFLLSRGSDICTRPIYLHTMPCEVFLVIRRWVIAAVESSACSIQTDSSTQISIEHHNIFNALFRNCESGLDWNINHSKIRYTFSFSKRQEYFIFLYLMRKRLLHYQCSTLSFRRLVANSNCKEVHRNEELIPRLKTKNLLCISL